MSPLLGTGAPAAAGEILAAAGGTIHAVNPHQLGAENNPYDGVSGNDFEFYRAHVDDQDRVIYDGPVVGDSSAWATSRIAASKLEFARAGLSQPTIFEFPHYAASATGPGPSAARSSVSRCQG